jgi:hypothetical protein
MTVSEISVRMTLASIQKNLRAVGNKYLNIPLTLGKVSADRRFLVVDQRGRCRIVWWVEIKKIPREVCKEYCAI